MNAAEHHHCLLCASGDTTVFLETPAVPVNIGVQWPTAAAARGCPRGDVRLTVCRTCGFIWNCAFDPAALDYSQAYDNALDYSPAFRAYAEDLAARLVRQYDLRGKEVIEIGCGKGGFLSTLCSLGVARGIGFDTSFDASAPVAPAEGQVEVIRDHYSAAYAHYQADLIVCRHVLEHIQYPLKLLEVVREAIGERLGTAVYFEVPNTLFILRDLSIWDIIYEHCCYFTRGSLEEAFRIAGFEVLGIDEAFGGQFLGVDARAAGPGGSSSARQPPADAAEVVRLCDDFAAHFGDRRDRWRERLDRLQGEGRRVVMWGAGAKGVTFMSLFDIAAQVEFVVDINPNKQGKYLPGTGQRIISPDELGDVRPDTVLLMNPVYEGEIREMLEQRGLAPEILSAHD